MTTSTTATISLYDIYGTETPVFDKDYIETGSFDIPGYGNTFLSPKGEVCTLEFGDTKPSEPRLLLRKRYMSDVYGTAYPVIPEGFVDGFDFRKGQNGDWVLGAEKGKSTGKAVKFSGVVGKTTEPRLILREVLKVGKAPKPEEIYGTTTPKAPEGYTLGEFEKVVDGANLYLTDVGHVMKGSAYFPCYDEPYYRYRLHPIPTPKEIYGTDSPAVPDGYKLGRFGKVEFGKNYLDRGSAVYSFIAGAGDRCQYRYELLPADKPKFKVGDRVLVNGVTPARVLELRSSHKLFDTKVVFDKSDGSIGWQASKYMKLDTTATRWLIEVESSEKPEGVEVVASRHGGWHNVAYPVLSITPKP